MARLRGRAKPGQRCRAPVPHGHWKTTTFTGALRLGGLTAPMVLDGPMNGDSFLAYVEHVLVPTSTGFQPARRRLALSPGKQGKAAACGAKRDRPGRGRRAG